MSDVQVSITVNFPMTEQNTKLARDMLEKAVQLDPNAADAAAWLADLTISDYLNCWNKTGKKSLQDAGNLADLALAAESPPPLAHYAKGFFHRAMGEHANARDEFHDASTAKPGFARAIAHEGAQLINLGEWDAGRQLVDQAIGIDPTSPSLGVFYYMKGRAFFFEAVAGGPATFDDAVDWFEQSRAERDNLWYNWAYLIAAYQLAGRPDDAATQLAAFKLQYGATITSPNDIKTKFETHNPNGDADPAVVQGRQTFLDTIAAIW